jgi:hypothetical protein
VTEIPSSVYVIIGTLIVANLGTVVTVFYGVGKLVWWASGVEHRLKTIETETTKDVNMAFQKIRDIENAARSN